MQEAEAWFGLVAPAKTPGEALTDLNRKVAATMATPEVQQQFAKLSFRPLTGSSDTLRQLIDEGHRRWGPVIKEAGIGLD